MRHMKTAALLQAQMMSEDPELQHEVSLQNSNAAHIDCCLLLRAAGWGLPRTAMLEVSVHRWRSSSMPCVWPSRGHAFSCSLVNWYTHSTH